MGACTYTAGLVSCTHTSLSAFTEPNAPCFAHRPDQVWHEAACQSNTEPTKQCRYNSRQCGKHLLLRLLFVMFSVPTTDREMAKPKSMAAQLQNTAIKLFQTPQRLGWPNHQQPSRLCTCYVRYHIQFFEFEISISIKIPCVLSLVEFFPLPTPNKSVHCFNMCTSLCEPQAGVHG